MMKKKEPAGITVTGSSINKMINPAKSATISRTLLVMLLIEDPSKTLSALFKTSVSEVPSSLLEEKLLAAGFDSRKAAFGDHLRDVEWDKSPFMNLGLKGEDEEDGCGFVLVSR